MNPVSLLTMVFALAFINMLMGTVSLKTFLSGTHSINSPIDLQNFAALVRRHMIQALLQLVFLLAGMVLGIYILASGQAGLLLILALNGSILVAANLGKKLEKQARQLPVSDPQLQESYQAICTSWINKPFPDF
ncbi:MAG: hypothetical protein JXI33_00350 [Candidatus Aminicenantes bacterium]|nr:hypothetical protein [Candidatus Aminicenantes bacterium]